MMMTEKFKILANYIKDMSSETKDIETFLFVKENISKYQLNIGITSKALKDKLIEIDITLKFEDKENNQKKSHYEIIYSTVIRVSDDIKDKKDIEKIVLCDVPNLIYPNLEKAFLNMLSDSGFPGIKLEKKIDFDKFPKNNFHVIGNINKKPKRSVAKPGIIKSIAANAIAAPETISYAGNSFLKTCENPDLILLRPSYFA